MKPSSGKAPPSIKDALSKAPDVEGGDDDESEAPSDLELSAMGAFDKAKTPQAKVLAFRALVRACGKDY